MNTGNFCTNCGAVKPVIFDAETKPAQPAETVAAEPAQTSPAKPAEAKPENDAVKQARARQTAAMSAAPAPKQKKKSSGRLLTCLLSALIGLGAGFGGGYLAVTRFAPQPTVVYQPAETASAEQEKTETAAPVISNVSTGSGLSIQEVAASASRTVVEIQTENQTTTYGFFGGTYTSKAAGSGVIIDPNGYIITNNHVVEGATKITVKTYDGTEYDAELIGTDEKTDIAVIKVDASGLSAAKIGDSDTLQVGDTAVVIGNPLGTLGGTVTSGIISATNRDMVINNQSMNLIQTNAAINNGNSGGGLFNDKGELVGIVNAKDSGLTSSGAVIEGLGFAIPINTAYAIASDLKENGYVTSRPTIGVGLQTMTSDYGIYKAGLYIYQVYEGSGAEEAGLKEYDRITAADGQEVVSYTDLSKVLAKKAIGDTLKLSIEREGKMMDVDVTLTGPLESMNNANN